MFDKATWVFISIIVACLVFYGLTFIDFSEADAEIKAFLFTPIRDAEIWHILIIAIIHSLYSGSNWPAR
jgi:hypothetical protein